MQSLDESTGKVPSVAPMSCPICGSTLYATDWGNCEITYHCSSSEARFWDFDRGSKAQHLAKEHWDKSLLEVFLTRDEEDSRAEKVA